MNYVQKLEWADAMVACLTHCYWQRTNWLDLAAWQRQTFFDKQWMELWLSSAIDSKVSHKVNFGARPTN